MNAALGEYDIYNDVKDRSASVVQIESNKLLPWIMVCATLSGIAVTVSLVCLLETNIAKTEVIESKRQASDEIIASDLARSKEYKQIQVQFMYFNSLLIRGGLIKQGDMVFGPEGNLEYDGSKFKIPKEK